MFDDILKQTFLDNSVKDYIICVFMIAPGLMGVKIFKFIILKKLKTWAEKTTNTIDDFLINLTDKTILPLLYLGIFYLGLKTLTLSSYLDKVFNILAIAVLTFFSVNLAIKLISYAFEIYWSKTRRSETLEYSLKGILKVIKFILWVTAIIFFLDNLGFKISAVIAGLGIGGVAIALAAQTILKDLFSYFSIVFDRPFEVGDFIIVEDLLGTVEHVGIKTTRMRSLGGEQLILSNSDLTDSRLRNYKRMEKRRIVFKLGIIYQTPLKEVKEIPTIIEKIIKGVKDTSFDRAHFFSYGDFSLIFEVVYYVLGSDYNKYMDIQQEINFAIKEEFEKRKIEFAFPTQTVYVTKR